MLIRHKKGWELRESEVTPEAVFHRRRDLLKAVAAGSILAPGLFSSFARAAGEETSVELYPAKQNPRYVLDRPLTDEKLATSYNNFYEFGSHKSIASAAQAMVVRPWTIKIDGLVEKPMTVDIDDLLKRMPLEERLYRHRCVEAWSMAVPWSGFPMASFVDFAKPLGSAKYVQMETFLDAKMAPGQKEFWYPWPYIEGVTMAEASNELAFLVTGMYGKPVPKQDGAPLRLALPWKYGFKSAKSIVRIRLQETQPPTTWSQYGGGTEYGFYANVNPEVDHPRWSQGKERRIGEVFRRPTLKFNGYADQVAKLYSGMDLRKFF